MSESSRIYLAYLTEPRLVGESSKRSPEHLTLVPPFIDSVETRAVATRAMAEVAKSTRSFQFRTTRQAWFGSEQNIGVYLIEPVEPIRRVHQALIDILLFQEIEIPDQYIGDKFMPHIAIKNYQPALKPNQAFTFDHIGLMQKTNRARTLLAIERFDERN